MYNITIIGLYVMLLVYCNYCKELGCTTLCNSFIVMVLNIYIYFSSLVLFGI